MCIRLIYKLSSWGASVAQLGVLTLDLSSGLDLGHEFEPCIGLHARCGEWMNEWMNEVLFVYIFLYHPHVH